MGFLHKIKRGGAETQIAIGVVMVFLVGILAIGAAAAGYPTDPGDPAISTTEGGSTTCSAWVNAPYKLQEIFRAGGRSYGITESMVGAIFLSENGSWSRVKTIIDGGGNWPSSPKGAAGPFQFMPDTWTSNQTDGGKQIDGGKDWTDVKDGEKDKNDIVDSSFGAARLIQAQLSNYAGKRFQTTDENDIKTVGACYNWGCGNGNYEQVQKYLRGEDNTVPSETRNYMTNIWQHFTNLNEGCDVLNIVPPLNSTNTGFVDFSSLVSDTYITIEKLRSNMGTTQHCKSDPSFISGCDTNPLGCNYKVFRPKTTDLAQQIVQTIWPKIGKGLPCYSSGAPVGELNYAQQESCHQCQAPIYYVVNNITELNNGGIISTGLSAFLQNSDKLQYIAAPAADQPRTPIQPGDIIDFIANNSPNRTCSAGHWAIAY